MFGRKSYREKKNSGGGFKFVPVISQIIFQSCSENKFLMDPVQTLAELLHTKEVWTL